MEKLCFYEGMGASQETRGRGMVCIGRGLVAGLSCSDLFFQYGVEFIQVDGELPCLSGCYLSFWVDGNIRIITFVCVKGGDPSGCTRGIIVSKICEGK